MKKPASLIYILLLVLIIADITFSFYQHLQMPLDGDVAESVVPAGFVKKILSDPFGMNVLMNKVSYPNPNRAFSHGTMMLYLRNIPVLFQHIFSPIDSVYVSNALLKTLVQVSMIVLFSLMIVGKGSLKPGIRFLIAMLLITPLFQTEGYNRYMGVIDQSISYTFFYALPFALLLLFIIPIYHYENSPENKMPGILLKLILCSLAIVLPFSSPLIPGVIIIGLSLFILNKLIQQRKVATNASLFTDIINSFRNLPAYFMFVFTLIFFLCAYSLYLGSYNLSNDLHVLSLEERYLKLPSGLYYILSRKAGWLLLLIVIVVNTIIIKRMDSNDETKRILNILNWIGVFTLMYILLLPFGGFREYRSNIIRYDTFIPITLCLIFYFGLSANYILGNFISGNKIAYLLFISLVLLFFTLADKRKSTGNECEKSSLLIIAQSNEEIVFLQNDCTILSWDKITDYRESEQNSQLLQIWKITEEKKLYYQK